MLRFNADTSIIVAGESGAGKTEAAKQILAYLARASTTLTAPRKKAPVAAGAGGKPAPAPADPAAGGRVAGIQDKIVTSTLIVEAFGNAMTLRNDNSSRFGKLVSVQFDSRGRMLAGKMDIYLLEKVRQGVGVGQVSVTAKLRPRTVRVPRLQVRVTTQGEGERGFHVFYYLLEGAPTELKRSLRLHDVSEWRFLQRAKIPGVSDAAQFKALQKCCGLLGFDDAIMTQIWRTLAVVLHLGNLDFTSAEAEGDDGRAAVNSHAAYVKREGDSEKALQAIAALMGVTEEAVETALTRRTLTVGSSTTAAVNNIAQAHVAAASLAKALYERLFHLVVDRINASLGWLGDASPADAAAAVGASGGADAAQLRCISILDIYGFEAFAQNGFAQLCINYTNEVLQQLFVSKILEASQREYEDEGIPWERVEYTDNKPVMTLLEGEGKKAPGVFTLLDDCNAVQSAGGETLLTQMKKTLSKHPRLHLPAIASGTFTVKHYAADVVYTAEEMVAANSDALAVDLVQLMSAATALPALHAPAGGGGASAPPARAGAGGAGDDASHRRAATTSRQFRDSVAALLRFLETTQPFYVKCIKSNDAKRALAVDDDRLRHQISCLGIVETTRVKRAGYAFSEEYGRFLARYRTLSKVTWPPKPVADQEAVTALLTAIQVWPPAVKATSAPAAGGAGAGTGAAASKWGGAGRAPAAAAKGGAGAPASGTRYPKLKPTEWPGDVRMEGSRTLVLGRDVALGSSKAFLKEPRTLFALEDMRMAALGKVVAKVQALWRGYAGKRWYARILSAWRWGRATLRAKAARRQFLRQKAAAVKLEAVWRGHAARTSTDGIRLREALGLIQWRGKPRRRLSLWWEARDNDFMGVKLAAPSTAAGIVRALARLAPPQTLASVTFGDHVWKIKPDFRVLRRWLMVTSHYVLNVHDPWMQGRVNRVISIADITGISMSRHADSYLVIHVGRGRYDYACICQTKIRLANAIVDAHQRLMGEGAAALPVNLVDTVEWRASRYASGVRTLAFEVERDPAKLPAVSPTEPWRGADVSAYTVGGGASAISVSPVLAPAPSGGAGAGAPSGGVAAIAAQRDAAAAAWPSHRPGADGRTLVVTVPAPPPRRLDVMLTPAELTFVKSKAYMRSAPRRAAGAAKAAAAATVAPAHA